MKSIALRAAIVGALSVGAVTTANAWDVCQWNNNCTNGLTAVTPDVVIYTSGSTAQDSSYFASFDDPATGLCAGAGDVYNIDGGNPAKPTNRLVLCTTNGNGGLAAGLNLAIFKESAVGSANGVTPLVAESKGGAATVQFIDYTTLTDASCANTTALAVPAGWTSHSQCTNTTKAQLPNAGLADVEARLLRAPTTGATISATDQALLNQLTGYDIVWGVPVTKNLYQALQSAEGLTASCPVVGGVANLDSPACAPSLSMEQVASLYSGKIKQWTQLFGAATPANNLTNPSGDQGVYICKRDRGSGTQASFEQYFLGTRCGGADMNMAAQDGVHVFTSGGGGGVETCMNAIANGGGLVIKPTNNDSFPNTAFANVTPAGGGWAIGILSTEINVPGGEYTNNGDSFRFIAVDGVLPTLANTVNGFWRYFSTTACYTIASGTGVPSTAQASVFTAACSNLGINANLLKTNANFAGQPVIGQGGDLAPPELAVNGQRPIAAMPATTANTSGAGANDINGFYKAFSGKVNNCDIPVVYDDATGTSGVTPEPNRQLGTGNMNTN